MYNYLVITASYWGFTLTDGALRTLVLFHFFKLGYSPFTLAFLFLLYEAAGIIANLAGGWLASRFGIRRMLVLGIGLQIGGLLFLSMLNPAWGAAVSAIWVVAAQGVAGVAKDITKTASKSAIKITSVDGNNQLFRWVAWFTGSKNATKGIGFFVGGLLLTTVGFKSALWLLVALLVVILVACFMALPAGLGVSNASKSVKELFSKSTGVNILAGARIFMFGARDVWFVVGLPVFLYSAGWDFWAVGGFFGGLDDSLWSRSGAGTGVGAAKPRRFAPRVAGSMPVDCCPDLCSGSVTPVAGIRRGSAAGAGDDRYHQPFGVWFALRGKFIIAFLSHSRICRITESSRGCRVLLCRECRWEVNRHAAVRIFVSGSWIVRMYSWIIADAGNLFAIDLWPAALGG
jgi:MFS family permease